jgi:hypothetical protein
MRDSYDLFNGGLEQLEQDLIKWEKELEMANAYYVQDLTRITKEGIEKRANWAEEQDTIDDVRNNNIIEFAPTKNSAEASMIVRNTSPKMTFAEFGYGILGKGTYQHNEFINQTSAGWQGYDLDGKKRGADRHWWYYDRAKQRHRSRGVNAKHIMFYSAQETIQRIPSEFTKYKGKLGLK